MKYKEAQAALKEALETQQTISTKRLAHLLQAMNVSLKKEPKSVVEELLKEENRKLREHNKKLQQRLTDQGKRKG